MNGSAFQTPIPDPLHAFSWPCWAWLAHGHLSAQCPFHTCGNLSPWWALARVKLQGWGAAQGAGARLVGPTARLTWTGRACGLRLQRCGLPLWEADVCGLGLFFGLHVSEGPCGHSPRGVVRRCPSYGAPTTGPLTLPVPARPRGLVQRGPGRVSAPHVVRGPEGEATSRASPRDARTLPLYPPQAPHQFPHLGVTWPPAARGCPPGPPGETSPQPLHGRPHTRAPSCRKPLYSGFQSLRMCRGWAPGPVPQEELVNPIKAAMADEAEVGKQVPATSPSSSLRGSCGGVGGAVPRGALLTAEQAA